MVYCTNVYQRVPMRTNVYQLVPTWPPGKWFIVPTTSPTSPPLKIPKIATLSLSRSVDPYFYIKYVPTINISFPAVPIVTWQTNIFVWINIQSEWNSSMNVVFRKSLQKVQPYYQRWMTLYYSLRAMTSVRYKLWALQIYWFSFSL